MFLGPASVQLYKKAVGFAIRSGVVVNSDLLRPPQFVCGDLDLWPQRGAEKRSYADPKPRIAPSENRGMRLTGSSTSRKSNSYCS